MNTTFKYQEILPIAVILLLCLTIAFNRFVLSPTWYQNINIVNNSIDNGCFSKAINYTNKIRLIYGGHPITKAMRLLDHHYRGVSQAGCSVGRCKYNEKYIKADKQKVINELKRIKDNLNKQDNRYSVLLKHIINQFIDPKIPINHRKCIRRY
jgi:hypothetical protein